MSEPGLAPAAVVLTKVAVAEALAAACAVGKVEVDAFLTPIGAVAVCRRTGAGEPEAVAGAVSQMLRTTPVVLLVQRDGRMTASRWSAGAKVEDLLPALMLDGAPPEVERLLLGQVRAADLPGVVTSVGMSRWRAMRTLARAGRAARSSSGPA